MTGGYQASPMQLYTTSRNAHKLAQKASALQIKAAVDLLWAGAGGKVVAELFVREREGADKIEREQQKTASVRIILQAWRQIQKTTKTVSK